MDKQRVLRKLVAAVLAAFGASGTALAAGEVEPNDSIASAQRLEIGSDGSASATGVIGTNTGFAVSDVDFYSFDAKEGDMVTIDIDNGMGGARDVDTNLTLYGPNTGQPLSDADDLLPNQALDTGSIDRLDPRIDSFRIPATGTYTVAVSGFPVYPGVNGTYDTQAGENGDYTLVISGVSVNAPTPVPPAQAAGQQIGIDIKKANGKRITVTLLPSGPLDVDVTSLRFGASGNEPSLKKCDKQRGERRRNLVCHFKTELTGLTGTGGMGVLKGKTHAGAEFQGSGTVTYAKRDRRDDDDD